MKVYQITCTGIHAIIGDKVTLRNMALYLNTPTKENIEAFETRCIDSSYNNYLSEILKTKIIELELENGNV